MYSARVLITHADFPRAGDFPLNGQVGLIGIGILEIAGYGQGERQNRQRESCGQVVLVRKKRTWQEWIKALLIGLIPQAGQSIQHALENRGTVQIGRRIQTAAAGRGNQTACRRRTARRKQLHGAAAVGGDGIESHGQQRMVVENSVTRANHGFAIAFGIPSQADARAHIFVTARDAFRYPEGLLRSGVNGGGGREERRNLDVVAETVVKGQLATHAPAVLREKSVWQIVEGRIGLPDALNVRRGNAQAVGLQRGGARQRGREAKSGSGKSPEVDVAAKIELENLRLRRAQLQYVDVGADLEGVAAAHQAEVISELKAPLDAVRGRIRLPPEISVSRYIHANVAPARCIGKAKVQTAARHLQAEFVERGGADDGVMLKREVEIAVLAHSGTRGGVLPRHLVL